MLVIKRIIPCLDVKDGRVVKGVRFENLKDAGDPVELARYYDLAGADELVFLDITATVEGRQTLFDLVERTAKVVSIPFIVGGGIGSIEQISRILQAGAEKVSLGTAALENPDLIKEGAAAFGRRHIVAAIDACWDEKKQDWEVYSHGGRKATGLSVVENAIRAEKLGAGEILLTSMNADGAKDGYDLALNRAVSRVVNIPVIASGGAGKMEDFTRVLTDGEADAALAASVFHYKKFTIKELKEYLLKEGVEVQLR